MAISYINGTGVNNGTSTPGLNVVLGNVLIVGLFLYDQNPSPTITDTAGNTFTAIPGCPYFDSDSLTYVWIFIAPVTNANSDDVFTCSADSYTGMEVDQYSGLTTTLDGSPASGSTASGGSGNLSTNSFNTSNADDLIYCVAAADSTGASWVGVSPLSTRNTTAGYISSADQIVSSTQSGYVATQTQSGGGSSAVIVAIAIKASGSPPALTFRGLSLLGVGQ